VGRLLVLAFAPLALAGREAARRQTHHHRYQATPTNRCRDCGGMPSLKLSLMCSQKDHVNVKEGSGTMWKRSAPRFGEAWFG